jgi:hypothetical protein
MSRVSKTVPVIVTSPSEPVPNRAAMKGLKPAPDTTPLADRFVNDPATAVVPPMTELLIVAPEIAPLVIVIGTFAVTAALVTVNAVTPAPWSASVPDASAVVITPPPPDVAALIVLVMRVPPPCSQEASTQSRHPTALC